MFTMRFDMRAPASGAPTSELYQAALEMCAWAERNGSTGVTLCEHHKSPDGYLPSPIPLAAAIAGRTTTLPITVALVLLPLYNPVRLAEEMCVVDIVSGGRVSYVAGIGYRPVEYEMYGVDFHRRGAIMEDHLAVLLRAVSGQPFEHDGRSIHVTPSPITPGGPRIALGGGSLPAVRRAGRFGLSFIGQKESDELRNAYVKACRDHGHEPQLCILPPKNVANTVFVANDLDAAWAEIGPYLMNDVLPYAAWNAGDMETSSLSGAKTYQDLREENRSHRILSVDQAVEWIHGGAPLPLHPIIGGLPPEIAWRYLETIAQKVLPQTVAAQ